MSKLAELLDRQAHNAVAELQADAIANEVRRRAVFYEIAQLLVRSMPDKVIQSIRILRSAFKISLRDAKDLIDLVREEENVVAKLEKTRQAKHAQTELENAVNGLAQTVNNHYMEILDALMLAATEDTEETSYNEIRDELRFSFKRWKDATHRFLDAINAERQA